MKIIKKIIKYSFVLFLFALSFYTYASSTLGTTNATYHFAQLCETTDCISSVTSGINFGHFTSTPTSNIIISDSELRGFAWGKSFGWVVLNCKDTISGCSSTNGNFKVSNNGEGKLSGYAWGQNSGWINFGPFANSSTHQIVINNSGEFNGYAWAQNYGWIKFDCSSLDYCTKTDWRPISSRSSSGTGEEETDVCPNISGTQSSIPSGYEILNGNCVTIPLLTDLCPNIVGVQDVVPLGYEVLNGSCIIIPPIPVDVCPNIIGIQSTVPSGYVILNGSCVVPEIDSCPNIIGVQSTIPDRYVLINGECIIPTPENDACINISGVQTVIPEGYIIVDGSCVIPLPQEDVCPNIFGIQSSVPENNILLNGECVDKNFCENNPTDISCVIKSFCELNPSDPTCVVVSATFCELNPGDPTCSGSSTTTDPDTTPITDGTNTGGDNSGNQVEDFINNVGNTISNVFEGTFGNTQIESVAKGVSESFVKTKEVVDKVKQKTSEVVNTPTGSISTKTIATTGVVAGSYFSIITALFANPITFTEIFLIPLRLWSLLMVAFGLKKRNVPWGTVYDSVTKQPLDPAYVVLQDLEGNEIATSITDLDGRYGFLVPAGKYRLLANKTNYEFPSKKMAGKSEDELYSGLYFSEIIEITEDGGVIDKNIPMDPLKFDWNEFAKKDQNKMKFFSKRDLWIAKISNILFALGLVISLVSLIVSYSGYNVAIFVIYIILLVLKNTIIKPRPFGYIATKDDGSPLSFAIMRVFFKGSDKEIIHKVADKTGKYYCLVPNGDYYVKVDNKNIDESYTTVHVSNPIEVNKGYINNKFKV